MSDPDLIRTLEKMQEYSSGIAQQVIILKQREYAMLRAIQGILEIMVASGCNSYGLKAHTIVERMADDLGVADA